MLVNQVKYCIQSTAAKFCFSVRLKQHFTSAAAYTVKNAPKNGITSICTVKISKYYTCDLSCGKYVAMGNIQTIHSILFNLYQNPYVNIAVAMHPLEDAFLLSKVILSNLLC